METFHLLTAGAPVPLDLRANSRRFSRAIWEVQLHLFTAPPPVSDISIVGAEGPPSGEIGEFEVGHDQNGTPISKSNSRTGYVLGAGAKHALTPRFSIGVPYDKMNLRHGRISLAGSPDISIDQHRHMDTVRAVVNYRF